MALVQKMEAAEAGCGVAKTSTAGLPWSRGYDRMIRDELASLDPLRGLSRQGLIVDKDDRILSR